MLKKVLVLSFFVITAISAQKIVDPQILAQQEETQKRVEAAGYGDVELDMLHREITALLVEYYKYAEKGTQVNNEKKNPEDANLILPVAFGESIKSMSERYVYNGTAHIWFDGQKLSKVMFRFSRINLLGANFVEEQRDLTNPTPNFSEQAADSKELPTLDRNDDLIINYSERKDESKPFEQIRSYTIAEIRYFEKRIAMIETYKKYLRRTKKILIKKIYDRELSQRVRVQYMLEMQ